MSDPIRDCIAEALGQLSGDPKIDIDKVCYRAAELAHAAGKAEGAAGEREACRNEALKTCDALRKKREKTVPYSEAYLHLSDAAEALELYAAAIRARGGS